MNNASKKLVIAFVVLAFTAGCGQRDTSTATPANTPNPTHGAEEIVEPDQTAAKVLVAESVPPVATEATSMPRGALAATPTGTSPRVYAADDSVCRWSYRQEFGGYGGGGGAPIIELTGTNFDAVVSELVGDLPEFRPDGAFLATVYDETEVRLWRADDGTLATVLPGRAFVFSPDSRWIAVLQTEGWYLGDAATGEERYILTDLGKSLHFSADSRTIVVTDDWRGGDVRLYDAETGTKLLVFQNAYSPTAISPDGTVFAGTTSYSIFRAIDLEVIVLWDTATGEKMHELRAEVQSVVPYAGMRGHSDISSITFSPDGQVLLSAGRDAIRLWSVATGKHLRCFQTPNHHGTVHASFGADGRVIIGTGWFPYQNWDGHFVEDADQRGIYLWDVNSNHPIGLLGPERDYYVSSNTHSNQILARVESRSGLKGAEERRSFLWSLGSLDLLAVFLSRGDVWNAALSPNGERAVTVSVLDDEPDDNERTTVTWLWDTSHGSVTLAAAAQTRVWDALEAAVRGEPDIIQQNLLHQAESLSPELVENAEQLNTHTKSWYAEYLEITDLVQVLSNRSEPAAKAFYAEIRNVDPKWLEWSKDQRVTEVSSVIRELGSWNVADGVAAYQEFVQVDPRTARHVVGDLLDLMVPDAVYLAQEGDVAGATEAIQEALLGYPDLDIQPEVEVRRLYAQTIMRVGYGLAAQGDLAGAIAEFKQALALDPDLGFQPEVRASLIHSARNAVTEGQTLAVQGNIPGALAKFDEALALDPDVKYDKNTEWSWIHLCWFGSLNGYAVQVLDGCDRAVRLKWNTIAGHDGRGLARALTGDVLGAIGDFEFAVSRAVIENHSTQFIASRRQWVEALRAGQDPAAIFDDLTLEKLRSEYPIGAE